jgi:hypothetical protein
MGTLSSSRSKWLDSPGIVGLKAYKVMPSGDTSSNEAFEWVMRQLQACNQSHKCYRLDLLFKPSRVVDVSSFKESHDVVLIDGSSMRDSQYVALSHCWGSFIPPCKATQATLLDRKTRISWAMLPRTSRMRSHSSDGSIFSTCGLIRCASYRTM